ncbi:hypothetical protein ABB29_04440 [Pseudoxanthomonas dokdonensis]|uniref:Uncharacterized protein n=1 Tax=Pseudoxanthomonas dokdonensis TaxID=344882 RepID=A0A0R0CMF4_9GAMM|nr:hypothetical protein ABB29_04440 [Pseudoxanthomonas dokdonensis]
MLGCAHAGPASDSAPGREAAAMTHSTDATSANPQLSAEEVGKRFLKLIEGLESRDDLSLERIKDVMGLSLRNYESRSNDFYAYSQLLEDDWYFSVDYLEPSPSSMRGVGLSFGKPFPAEFESNPMPASLCVLDFEHYRDALTAIGYRDVPIYGEIGNLIDWRFYKSDITLSVVLQNIVPGEPGLLCVKSIGTLN